VPGPALLLNTSVSGNVSSRGDIGGYLTDRAGNMYLQNRHFQWGWKLGTGSLVMRLGQQFESARRLSFTLICRENTKRRKGPSIESGPIYCIPCDHKEHQTSISLGR
jgi:hypothetical protein